MSLSKHSVRKAEDQNNYEHVRISLSGKLEDEGGWPGVGGWHGKGGKVTGPLLGQAYHENRQPLVCRPARGEKRARNVNMHVF